MNNVSALTVKNITVCDKGKETGGETVERKEHICFEIRIIQNLICEIIKDNKARNDVCVTQLQHWIIRYLDANPDKDIYQKDLEEVFKTSRATISNTLQVMERNDLIIRTSVEQDARLKRLTLTEKARAFRRKVGENVESMEALMRKGMTPEEEEIFVRLLHKVRENLEEEHASRQEGHSCGIK